MKTSPPQTRNAGPQKSERDFQELPADQAEHCAFYEYARAVPALIQAVDTYRQRSGKPLRTTPSNWNQLDFALLPLRLLLRILTECPEFPATPWLQIAPGERRRRIMRYTAAERELEHFLRRRGESSFKVLEPAKSKVRIQALMLRADLAAKNPSISERLRGEVEDLVCSIDWRKPLKTLEADFREWAARSRPANITLNKDRTLKTCQENLTALAALRLIHHFQNHAKSASAAIDLAAQYTQSFSTRREPLFESRESWFRAKGRAEDHLARLAQVVIAHPT